MNETTEIIITADKKSVECLNKFCQERNISVNQYILNAVAERVYRNGESFFWVNHQAYHAEL